MKSWLLSMVSAEIASMPSGLLWTGRGLPWTPERAPIQDEPDAEGQGAAADQDDVVQVNTG